jgi:glutathione S-transferase
MDRAPGYRGREISAMQLWYTTTSPFARKVRIAAAEHGLDEQIALVRVDPWTDQRLRALNPLCKVPTLVLEDGTALAESAVICEWLDSVGVGRRLFPAPGPRRWRALCLQGLADGAMTATGRLFAEERRPEGERAGPMAARFTAARDAVLDRLDAEELQLEPEIGEIAVAALLAYLDFRWPERPWRDGRPRLSAWMDRMAHRPSMLATEHR